MDYIYNFAKNQESVCGVMSPLCFSNKKMKFKKLVRFASFVVATMLVACGGGAGPELGDFPALNKTEGDEPFTLTAPTSDGPGAFTYTSSNTAVATISSNIVTIVGVGTTTITATQAAVGSFNSSSTTAVLTVSPRKYVVRSGNTWMPVSIIGTWSNANTYCTTSTINGLTGWRLPTEFELKDLYASGAMKNQGGLLSKTWSSTEATTALTRIAVNLNDGTDSNELESNSAYIACVR